MVNLKFFQFLNKYIPDTLFTETDLPCVRIYKPRVPKRPPERGIVAEDITLALSVYLPGRPSFRHWEKLGIFIPISSRRKHYYYSNIEKYCDFDVAPIDEEILSNSLPEEYKCFLEYNNITFTPQAYRLLSIRPHAFYGKNHKHRRLYWVVLFSTHGTLSLTEYLNLEYSKKKFNKEGMVLLRLLRKESISYGRFASSPFNFNPLQNKGLLVNNLLKEMFSLQNNPLEYGILDVFRYIYAFDYNLCFYLLRISDKPCFSSILKASYISEDDIETGSICADILRKKGNFRGVKAFCSENSTGSLPLVYGYVAEKTRYLKLKVRHLINSFLNDLFKEYDKISLEDDVSFKEFYKVATINQVLVNVLKNIIMNDLSLSAMFSSCRSFSSLLDAAFTYNDLYSSEKVSDMIHKGEGLADKISEILRIYNEKLCSDPKAYVLALMLHGERISSCKKLQDSNSISRLRERINKFFNIAESRKEIAYSIIVHSLNHYLISAINSISAISSEYLSEIYDLSFEGQSHAFIYENVSGGIGAIESALNQWSKSPEETVEYFLLKLGKCLIGTSEDLLFFMLKKYRVIDSNRQNMLNTIKELNIIVTPEEFEETRRLYNAFIEDAKSLSSILKNGDYRGVIREVIDARYSVEKDFKRFVDSCEILAYIIKNLEKYQSIKTLLVMITERLLKAKKNMREKLTAYYSTTSTRLLAEKVINEFHLLLADVEEISKLKLKYLLTSKKAKETKILIELFRVLDAALRKLYLKSCNNVCGLCYLNSKSCGRYGAPWVQEKMLSRRLLKLFSSWLLERNNLLEKSVRDEYLGKIIGKIIIGNNVKYIKSP